MKKYNNVRENKLKSKRGSVSLLVAITIFTFVVILLGTYLTIMILRQSQYESNIRIQEIYGKDVNRIDEIYTQVISDVIKIEDLKNIGTYVEENQEAIDSNGNKVVIPAGFKVASDSGINITEGIVIEDNDITEDGKGNLRGNQYVWVPVGKNMKKSDEENKTIILGRYKQGNLTQSSINYKDDTEDIIIGDYHKELVENPENTNTVAYNLLEFINSVNNNGGFYIARYEASYGVDGKVNSKVSKGEITYENNIEPTEEGTLWTNITQPDAAIACRNVNNSNMNNNYYVDLVNSYAWDTAIIYINNFSEKDNYSEQTPINTAEIMQTGTIGDEVCKINDMASNIREWTTEYSADEENGYHCTYVGGGYEESSVSMASSRFRNNETYKIAQITFRSILYLK